MCSRSFPGQPTAAETDAARKCCGILTHFIVSSLRYVTRISMDGIIEDISSAFGDLQDSIARLSAIGTPNDDFHTLDETADLFSAWLRNVAVIRAQCKTFEHCLNTNSELKATLVELLRDAKDDLAEGGCIFLSSWQ